VVFETPEAVSLDALEDCSDAIFETPVVGSAGAPLLSCYFTFGTPTSGLEFSPARWVTGPSRAERGPDPAPVSEDSGAVSIPIGPARAPPPAPDPWGWFGAEVELAGGPGSPVARPASEDLGSSGDRLEEESVSVEDTGGVFDARL